MRLVKGTPKEEAPMTEEEARKGRVTALGAFEIRYPADRRVLDRMAEGVFRACHAAYREKQERLRRHAKGHD